MKIENWIFSLFCFDIQHIVVGFSMKVSNDGEKLDRKTTTTTEKKNTLNFHNKFSVVDLLE